MSDNVPSVYYENAIESLRWLVKEVGRLHLGDVPDDLLSAYQDARTTLRDHDVREEAVLAA